MIEDTTKYYTFIHNGRTIIKKENYKMASNGFEN